MNPQIPVLALNDVNTQSDNVWQFSLAKQQDAAALNHRFQKDRIKKLFIVRETGTESATELLLSALKDQFSSE